MAGSGTQPVPRLLELIGEDRLKRILREFSAATGAVVTATTDNVQDIPFSEPRPPSTGKPLCSELIQEKCGKRPDCERSDREAAQRASEQTEPHVYECPLSGLWEFCVAVRVNGSGGKDEVTGYLFGGQVADLAKETTDFYRLKAAKLGADPEEFLRLLEQNTTCSEEQVRAYAKLLGMLANDLSDIAQEHAEDQERAEALHQAALAISAGPGFTVPDVLEQILSEVDKILEPDEATVWVVDRDNPDRLVCGLTHRGLPTVMPEDEKPSFALRGSRKEMGVIGQIAAGSLPELVSDLQAHQDDLKYPEYVKQMATRCHMAVRLPAEGSLLGVLEVGSKQEGRYSEDDLRMLRILGNDIVAAIHNAQLYESLTEQQARIVPQKDREIRRLHTLLDMHQAFAPGIDEEGVLKLLLRHTLALLRSDAGMNVYGHVRRVEPQTSEAVVLGADDDWGPGYKVVPQARAADDPLTHRVTLASEVLYLPDVNQDQVFMSERERLSGERKELYNRVASLLICPVRCGAAVGGHLVLYRVDPGGFDDPVRNIVRLLCERAGDALTNAYERRRVNDSASLRLQLENIGSRLSGLTGRDETIQAATKHARDLVGSDCAILFYLRPMTKEEYLVLREIAAPNDYPDRSERARLSGTKLILTPSLHSATDRGEVIEIEEPKDVRYPFLLSETSRALLAPMRYRYGAIFEGFIVAESRSKRPFTERQREAMKLLGSQTAVHVARSRALGEDYAAFVHHFSRPMVSLRAFLRQCEQLDKDGSLPDDLRQIAEQARGTYEHFHAYDVAFSPAHSFRPEEVTIAVFVDGALDSARRTAGEREIQAVYIDDCGSAPVRVDPPAMRGALLELIYNAMTYDPDGHPIRIVCEAADDHCRIKVEDSGAIITPERAEHLFDLRTPIGEPGERSSGLGLWMVRTVAERHGGQVHLDWPGHTPKAFVLTIPVIARSECPEARR